MAAGRSEWGFGGLTCPQSVAARGGGGSASGGEGRPPGEERGPRRAQPPGGLGAGSGGRRSRWPRGGERRARSRRGAVPDSPGRALGSRWARPGPVRSSRGRPSCVTATSLLSSETGEDSDGVSSLPVSAPLRAFSSFSPLDA